MTIRIGSQHLVPPALVALWLGLLVSDRLLEGSILSGISVGLAPAPLALLGLLVFLAIRLNQLLPVCLGLEAAALAFLPSLGFDVGVLGVACALCTLACFIVGENGVVDIRGLIQGCLVLLLPALALLLARLPWILGPANARPLALPPAFAFPQPALLVLLLAGIAMGFRMRGASGFFSYAALWSLAPVFGMLDASSEASRRLALLAGLIVMLYGVYRLYWQRVYLDELTGIPGRRAFEENQRRLFGTYAIGMLDVDHFKGFNDTWGHPEGDNVLRWVARQLRATSGSNRGVSVFRYGGEEFALLFRGPAVPRAAEVAEQVRLAIASTPFSIRSVERATDAEPADVRKGKRRRGKPEKRAERVSVTVSMGVAWSAPELRKAKDVLREADQALYRAKAEGRNRVASAGGGPSPAKADVPPDPPKLPAPRG